MGGSRGWCERSLIGGWPLRPLDKQRCSCVLQQELTTRTTELEEQKAFGSEMKRTLEHLREQCTAQESNNRELRISNERHLKEIENINANLTKTQLDYEKQNNMVDHLQMVSKDLLVC